MLPVWTVEKMAARFPLGTWLLGKSDLMDPESDTEAFRVVGYSPPISAGSRLVSGMLEVERVGPLPPGVESESCSFHPELAREVA